MTKLNHKDWIIFILFLFLIVAAVALIYQMRQQGSMCITNPLTYAAHKANISVNCFINCLMKKVVNGNEVPNFQVNLSSLTPP